jgi:hypothetical protein
MLLTDPSIPTDINQGLNAITAWIKLWGVPLAGIGTISMALLQTAKNVFPLRQRFQEQRIRAWLTARDAESAANAEKDLIALVMAGDRTAFYNSDIDQLCTQIKSSLTAALDYPTLHEALIACLASSASKTDLEKLFDPPHADVFLKGAQQSTTEEKEAIRQYATAKTRVGAEMRCAIDAIESAIAFRWKRTLQIASLFLSAIVGVIALHISGSPGLRPTFGASIVIGLLAGFLAPVARDLVAAIENWRGN